nr:beta-ketoacyl synthase N-terminal-like domain-containing protein [Nostoc sp. CHAB 5715]
MISGKITQEKTVNLDIAIVGMSGCFPGAQNIDMFWHNLRNGVESISFFENNELADLNIEEGILNDPNYVKAVPILKDIEYFDAGFYGCKLEWTNHR